MQPLREQICQLSAASKEIKVPEPRELEAIIKAVDVFGKMGSYPESLVEANVLELAQQVAANVVGSLTFPESRNVRPNKKLAANLDIICGDRSRIETVNSALTLAIGDILHRYSAHIDCYALRNQAGQLMGQISRSIWKMAPWQPDTKDYEPFLDFIEKVDPKKGCAVSIVSMVEGGIERLRGNTGLMRRAGGGSVPAVYHGSVLGLEKIDSVAFPNPQSMEGIYCRPLEQIDTKLWDKRRRWR